MNITGDAYPSLTTPAETLSTLFNGSTTVQDMHTPNVLLKKGDPRFSTMNAWYYMASQDSPLMLKRVADQAILADHDGITVKQIVATGHHGFLIWKEGYEEGLPWLMHRLRLTSDGK